MTATVDFMNAEAAAPTIAPVRIADGGRMLVRAAQRLTGAALVLAALGLWMAPGAGWENDVMLFKLILSITAGLAGLGLLQSSATPKKPEIEIDTIRREVRLVRVVGEGKNVVLQRCAFSDLARAERDGMHVRLWDSSNTLLAEVSLADRTAMTSLMAGLHAAGKIA
ncbi:MAG: hypothetical protein ACSHWS_07940 [Sulfitobacter sp.]